MTDHKKHDDADESKTHAKAGKRFYNAGLRTYNLTPKNEGDTHHAFAPGQTVEVTDEAEAKRLSEYHDVKDIAKMGKVSSDDSEVAQLKAELEAAKVENAKLREDQEPKHADHKSGKK